MSEMTGAGRLRQRNAQLEARTDDNGNLLTLDELRERELLAFRALQEARDRERQAFEAYLASSGALNNAINDQIDWDKPLE